MTEWLKTSSRKSILVYGLTCFFFRHEHHWTYLGSSQRSFTMPYGFALEGYSEQAGQIISEELWNVSIVRYARESISILQSTGYRNEYIYVYIYIYKHYKSVIVTQSTVERIHYLPHFCVLLSIISLVNQKSFYIVIFPRPEGLHRFLLLQPK